MNTLDFVFGPLATLECRRAIRPRWLAWLRMLTGIPAAGIAIITLWIWMLWRQIEPGFLPADLLTGGLMAIEMTQVVLALLLAPALIAGALASEKDRGTLALLLSSRLTAREIVLGRLAGCYVQIAMLAAAAIPSIVVLAALRQAGITEFVLLIGLPAAVSFGGAGLTLGVSALARRGRDALLTVYMLEVLGICAAILGSMTNLRWFEWIGPLNPFEALFPLVEFGVSGPAALSALLWIIVGVAGAAFATWQLRPAFYRQTGGESSGRRTRNRRTHPVSDRPMMWKELRIGSAGSLGIAGRWLSRLLVLVLFTVGTVALVMQLHSYAMGNGLLQPPMYVVETVGFLSTLLLWLVQWAVGLRAAGVICSERQQSTWDALLASPLEAREVIVAKICGSIYALRWLIIATFYALSAAAFAGQLPLAQYCISIGLMFGACAFMATAGTAVSLTAKNATRGMAVTIGLWMAAAIASAVMAFVIALLGMLVGLLFALTSDLASGGTNFRTTHPDLLNIIFFVVLVVSRIALYFGSAIIIALWITARFDRLAGRVAPSLLEEAREALEVLAE